MQSPFPTLLTPVEFGQLYEKYKSDFMVVARSYVRDQTLAEDIVMDCFMYFWENRHKIEIRKDIPSYILTAVQHRSLNWLRDERNRLKIQQKIHTRQMRVISERIASIEADDPNSVFALEITAIVARELERMPERTKVVFLASRIEDLTYREIAEKFHLTVKQVDFEMQKASKTFYTALKDYLPIIFSLISSCRIYM